MATFTDFNGNTYKGKFKDGQVDGQRIKLDRPEGRRKFRQVGLARFIPKIVLDRLDIKLPKGNPDIDEIGHLVETHPKGVVKKAYYKEYFFWYPERNGFCEQFIPKDYKWTEADYATSKQFDTFIGIYWNGERNGYGIKYYKGKVVEKGIYQGGQFVKSEDFDLELMQKTFKKWY